MNWELSDVQTGFRKGRGTRNQIVNIRWITEKTTEFEKKKSTSASLTMLNPLTVWITINFGKFLKRWEYQTTWPASWGRGQESTIRTGHGTTDCFQIGKGVHQGWILSPCLFNLYAEYIMRSAGLEETQGGIKIARKNINNLRYAEDYSNCRKWRGNKKPLDESKGRE